MIAARTGRLARLLALGLSLALGPALPGGPARADTPATTQAQREAEVRAAWSAADAVAAYGPAGVRLLDQADLALPQGVAFVPGAAAARVLRAYGNRVGTDPVGLLTGTGSESNWIAVVRFVAQGYIKDDDARDWNADDLLASLKENNAATNEDRVKRGFPQVEIVGWVEKPAYDAATHRLVWSIASRQQGEADGADHGINYNTYALGRDGYFTIDFISSLDRIEAQKPLARSLIGGLTYVPGKAYGDFNASTDKIAAYGLAALVGGVAVKKLGLFAAAAAVALKFGKVGLLALAGIGAVIARLFGRRKAAGRETA